MDESYMREYFERNQEVFYMRFRKDESKWTLEKERAQAVDSFREKYVHGEAMEADFEAMVNAIWNDDYEAHGVYHAIRDDVSADRPECR